MTIQLSEKDRFLLQLAEGFCFQDEEVATSLEDLKDTAKLTVAKEKWQQVRESELEEMLDDPAWKEYYPEKGRDKVRGLIRQEAMDALGRLESHIKAAEVVEMISSAH